jgi:hypothetical protein
VLQLANPVGRLPSMGVERAETLGLAGRGRETAPNPPAADQSTIDRQPIQQLGSLRRTLECVLFATQPINLLKARILALFALSAFGVSG